MRDILKQIVNFACLFFIYCFTLYKNDVTCNYIRIFIFLKGEVVHRSLRRTIIVFQKFMLYRYLNNSVTYIADA